MENRRRILDLFDEQEPVWKRRVSDGIERFRKGDAEIALSSGGAPVPGASVNVEQISHEFRFGANLFMLDEFENEEKNEKYRKAFAGLFNTATLPFYWDSLEPVRGLTRYGADSEKIYRRPAPDRCLEFCSEHGIEPREHGLAYEHFFPNWLKDASVPEIRELLEKRFAETASRYAGKIPVIEVTNEMNWQRGKTAFYDDPDYVLWCFKTAEKYFPDNVLAVNESTLLAWKDCCRSTDKYYSYIEANMLKGARIDAVGMQFHLFNKPEEEYDRTRLTLNPDSLYRHMDLYARLGRPLQITEVTVPAFTCGEEDEALQAEIIEKLYSVWFSHPAVSQIIYWNLPDGYAHVWDSDPEKIKRSVGNMTLGENSYRGGLLRFDLSPKPAYLKIRDLTRRVWHTEEKLTTDSSGRARFRGFYGDYRISVRHGDGITEKTFSLKKGSENSFSLSI